MIRASFNSLRCALVALLALSIVSARPAMLLAHAGPAAEHGCGMQMSHGAQHSGHHCSGADAGSCCDDCLCGCAVGAGFTTPLVALVAVEARRATVLPNPVQSIRARWSPALRLPPPIGPPLSTRS